MLFRTRRRALAALAFVALLGSGCRRSAGLALDAAVPDSGPARPDAWVRPDAYAPTPCTEPSQCDDGIDCTDDRCESGLCTHLSVAARCDDGLFCNGQERCSRTMGGCVSADRDACDDQTACTTDRCEEGSNTCSNTLRDLDDDGEGDFLCGGTDCDDRDPTRSTGATERCGDTVDNDCDRQVDESGCQRPPGDGCEDPIDVSAGGRFVVSTRGASIDAPPRCIGDSARDVVLAIDLAEPRDLRVSAGAASFYSGVELRGACADRETSLECWGGYPAVLRRRALPAGRSYLVVGGQGEGDIEIDVELSAVTAAPENDTCAAPLDISGGGRFEQPMVDITNDIRVSCSSDPGSSPDLVYQLTTGALHDVDVAVTASGGEQLSWELRSVCSDPAEGEPPVVPIQCTSGAPALGTVRSLPAGTYYLVVDGPAYLETDIALDVQLRDPSPIPAGDTCDEPIPLVLGDATIGTLADKQSHHAMTCASFLRDAVYSFTLTERRDVLLLVNAGFNFVQASVRRECGDSDSDLECLGGSPIRRRFRDLPPGTYFVIVTSANPGSFQIAALDSEPIVPAPVGGNDRCATPFRVPEGGGVFVGSTEGFEDEELSSCGTSPAADAVFEIDLARRQRVIANTNGSSFDTLLHLHEDSCYEPALRCDDDSGQGNASQIDATLEPGTYYLLVDARDALLSGSYVLDLYIGNP